MISRDQLICSSLEEKLQVFATLSALSGRTDASPVDPRLLVQPHSEDVPQAAVLLAAALQEGETFDIPCAEANTDAQHSWFAFCLLTVQNKKKKDFSLNLNLPKVLISNQL